ncbi:MAG: peptidylprolyl isomerase [Minwuia sp.]|nr:peptidylprolyl isomerase [Minwuia sp.]
MRAFLIALTGLLILTGNPDQGRAQQVFGIAAVVNDEVISAFDLEERIDLVVVSANLPRTQDTRRRIRSQVLRNLTDESLQMQAARKIGVEVTNEQIDEEIANLAERNNLSVLGLTGRLEGAGVDLSTLRRQYLASIAWEQYVSARLLRTVDVSDEEIDEAIRQQEASRGQVVFNVREIILGVDRPQDEPEVRAAAERLVKQIQSGADFAALARQFSVGADAEDGGKVGWVRPAQLSDEVAAVLATLSVGQVSDPIQTPLGFTIVAVEGRRILGEEAVDSIEVELAQLLIPLGRAASDVAVAAARSDAEAARGRIRSCAGIDQVAETIENAQPAQLGTLKIGDLPDEFSKAIAKLNIGDSSVPLRTAAGIHVLVICNRSQPVDATPDRAQVRNNLILSKLNQRARSALRDLRRDAIIDLR